MLEDTMQNSLCIIIILMRLNIITKSWFCSAPVNYLCEKFK